MWDLPVLLLTTACQSKSISKQKGYFLKLAILKQKVESKQQIQ